MMEIVLDLSAAASTQASAATQAMEAPVQQRESLDHGPYVLGAYALTLVGLALLMVWSWQSMRRAEQRREGLKRTR